MKRMIQLLLLAGAALLPLPSLAADMPAKAAPAANAPTGYPSPTGTGLYGQVGTFADLASSSINTGTSSTNLFSTGGAVSIGAGWQYKLPGSNFGFTEVNASYMNLGGATSCVAASGIIAACSVKGPWSFSVGTAMGFNWTYPLTFIPSLASLFNGNTPSSLLPAGVAPTASVPYAGLWMDVDNVSANISGLAGASTWDVSPEFRLGLINYLPQGGGVLKTAVGYEWSQNSLSLGPASAKMGNQIKAYLEYAF